MSLEKKELYKQLNEKIISLRQSAIASLEDVKKFAKENDLILIPDELNWLSSGEFGLDLISQISVPTDEQIADNWTHSNIECGYKPDPEPYQSQEWEESNNWSASDSCTEF